MIGAVLCAMFISIAYVNLDNVLALGGINTSAAQEAATETAVETVPDKYSVGWCIAHPLQLCLVYLNTLRIYGKYYFTTMFGGLLGWLEIHVSNFVIYLVAALTMFTLFTENKVAKQIKVKHRVLSILIIFAVFMLILLSMFFACSPYGEYVVLGVQGRYFLPILPLFLVVVGNDKIRIKQSWTPYILYSLLMVNIYAIFQIFATVASR